MRPARAAPLCGSYALAVSPPEPTDNRPLCAPARGAGGRPAPTAPRGAGLPAFVSRTYDRGRVRRDASASHPALLTPGARLVPERLCASHRRAGRFGCPGPRHSQPRERAGPPDVRAGPPVACTVRDGAKCGPFGEQRVRPPSAALPPLLSFGSVRRGSVVRYGRWRCGGAGRDSGDGASPRCQSGPLPGWPHPRNSTLHPVLPGPALSLHGARWERPGPEPATSRRAGLWPLGAGQIREEEGGPF